MAKHCIECESIELVEVPRTGVIRGQRKEWTEYQCRSCGHIDHEVDESETTYTRIRFTNPDQSVSVLDLAFLQVVEVLSGLTREEKGGFWGKKETVLKDGRSAFLVRERDE